eukprot:CAMPEP_0173351316 /NCGR_PEP_ID=MMETSP1144-20121109/15388_1 /TAXON_ID=483371 /ORGANISM="non described non described, Strain CCMP2298" /LENGTH=334 /DNA_ID=CAMNT_0014299393 /DNA_START=31 /DNA_END=1035 /DNA_ORIENTATION=+
MSFDYDGRLVAVAGKDRAVRIVDARAGRVVSCTEEGASHSLAGSRTSTTGVIGRNLRVAWCAASASTPLLTVSAGSSGLRQMHLWDPRSLSLPLLTKALDSASGQLLPLWDEDMRTLFLAGKGDTVVRSFELLFLEETTAASSPAPSQFPFAVEKSTDFQTSSEPIAGLCLLPKRCCDVGSVEVARLLKLTSSAMLPLSYKVPRAAHLSGFFHDDVYPPTRSRTALATLADWTDLSADVCVFTPLLESLQPADMVALSDAPKVAAPSTQRSKVDSFKLEREAAAQEASARDDQFRRLQRLAQENAVYNVNRSGGGVGGEVKEEVDSDDNWSDDD